LFSNDWGFYLFIILFLALIVVVLCVVYHIGSMRSGAGGVSIRRCRGAAEEGSGRGLMLRKATRTRTHRCGARGQGGHPNFRVAQLSSGSPAPFLLSLTLYLLATFLLSVCPPRLRHLAFSLSPFLLLIIHHPTLSGLPKKIRCGRFVQSDIIAFFPWSAV
jgi:hypothetical protein